MAHIANYVPPTFEVRKELVHENDVVNE